MRHKLINSYWYKLLAFITRAVSYVVVVNSFLTTIKLTCDCDKTLVLSILCVTQHTISELGVFIMGLLSEVIFHTPIVMIITLYK